MSFSLRKKHPKAASAPAPPSRAASGFASSQVTQQLQFPTSSQSHLQSLQENQQSQPFCPWSAHSPPFELSPSPFLRDAHALSTSATSAGELFLFGGCLRRSKSPLASNDLHVISTRNFSVTLLKTNGDVPSPRYGHRAVITGTILLIWGGKTDFSKENAQSQSNDDSFYLLNLVSREWTRIVVNGPGPGARFYFTMTLTGSKLFLFGGRTPMRYLNDIWTLDLNYLESNPFWESYESAPGNEKPAPRAAHVSVTAGDHIVLFGGRDDSNVFNDTWLFNISTRKWSELQCTGSIPSPRAGHAAVLIDNVMYVYGGGTLDGTYLDDLTALNLTTQRWTAFQGSGPSPSGRFGHAMACDGTRVFVLGGLLSPGVQTDETKLIHVLDTKHLDYSEPDSDEMPTQLVGGPPARGQPYLSPFSLSNTHAAHRASPFQIATPEELDRSTSQQNNRWQNPSPNGLPSRPTGVSGRSRRVMEEDDDSEGSENGRLIVLEHLLSETLAAKAERDRHIAQLTEQLAQKCALLELAESNAAEAQKQAELERRELQANLDELILSRNEYMRGLEQAQIALQKATSRAADAKGGSRPEWEYITELAQVRSELEGKKSELEAVRLRLKDAENRYVAKGNAGAGLDNTDADPATHRIMERMRTMEADMASGRWNEKSREDMECRNED